MALRLPAIMKTTAARLSALYLILFAICAVLLVFYMTSLSASMLATQTKETINEEVQGLDRAYRRGGLPFLVRVTTCPAWRIRYSSRRNSRGCKSIFFEARRTVRVRTSISRSATV